MWLLCSKLIKCINMCVCICSYPWGIQRHVCLVQPVCRPRPSFQPWCHRTICRRAAQCLNMCLCVCACIFSPQGFFAMFHVIFQVNKHEQWERRIWVKYGVLNRKHCQWRLLTLPVKSCTQQTSCFGFQVYFEGFFSVGHCQGLKMSHHRIYYMFYTILYSVFPAAPGTQCITITGETLNLRVCITLIYFIDRAL